MSKLKRVFQHKRELLNRVLLTSKGSWFQDPEYGLDYNLLYSDPSPIDVEIEIKRALSHIQSIAEIVSVSSALLPQSSAKDACRLLISIQILFEDGEDLVHVFQTE